MEMRGLRRPGRSASPPRPAAGRPGWISIQRRFLSFTPLISWSHSAPSCLRGFILLCFSFHLFGVTVCFYFSLFLMRVLLFLTTSWFLLFIFLSFLLLSLFAEGAALKAFTLSDNLNGNVLIYPEPDAVLSPENCHQWKRPLPNIITLMSVWSHTQEIK